LKLVRRTLIPALLLLLTLQFAAAQVPSFSPFTADLHITSTRADRAPQDVDGKIFFGSGHVRMNLDAGGHQTAIITDFATKTSDVLMIEQQMYIESKGGQMSRGPGSSFTQELKPYDPEHPCASQPDVTCKKIGVEQVNGRTCDHWELTEKNGKVSNLWIDQKLHLPIKIVSDDSTITLSNIKEGQPDANLFKVPDGFKKLDMGGMVPPGTKGPVQTK
jgi:hypothetical protein